MGHIESLIQLEDIKRLTWQARSYLRDMRLKKSFIAGEQVSYLEGGKGAPVILLHGYNGNVHIWRMLMEKLMVNHRVIAVEVPGFGLNSRVNRQASIYFRSLVRFLDEFTRMLRLESFHLAGTSVGSTLACYFALEYPEKVRTLTLMSIPPLFKERDTRPTVNFDDVDFYVPQTVEEVDRLFAFMWHVPPAVPRHLRERFAEYNARNRESKIRVLQECDRKTTMLVPRLSQIRPRTLFIYGEHDRMVSAKTLDYLEAKIPDVQTYRIEKAGHLVYVENPGEVGAVFNSFMSYNRMAPLQVPG
ncbi:MAG: alpha/beta hydrolase [Ketobacteraceae bacterium]|nr:alpha/beta hydrolase [Ketobacteraceae bacterium]